jgi:hypothetical protein
VADTKISALTAVVTPATTDEFAVNQAGASKKMTLAQLETFLEGLGLPRVRRLNSQHSISSATGTKVTGLDITLEPGTYAVDYYLIVRSSLAATGVMVGVNFTGTAAVKSFVAYWPDGSTALSAYTDNMDDEGVKGLGVIAGMATKTYTTTAPNLGTTVGVTTTAADITMRVSGLMIVTAQGNLELWHSSEDANATSVEVGSSLIVIRTA